jgi:hypothetical protein
VDDQRIEQALEDAAPLVDTGRVLDRVASKRTRRRTVRRIEAGALALVVVAVVGLTAALVTRDDGSSPHVAAPSARLTARVITGDGAVNGDAGQIVTPTPVDLDADPGVLTGPMYVGTTYLSTASHDRGTDGVPLTHIVRIDGEHVVDVVDLKAGILSITEGEGARWAVTRNARATGGTVPDAFLKRIGTDGVPKSTPLPVDAEVTGPVAAIGGAVWVPTRAGVEQFDTNGDHVRSITLDPAATRSIAAIGKAAWVTDPSVGLRRLDPELGATSEIRHEGEPPLRWVTGDISNGWLLLGATIVQAVGPALQPTHRFTLPTGFTPATVAVADGRAWVTGTVDDAPAIVLLGVDRVAATIVLQNGGDAALTWTAPGTVTAVTDGELVRMRVP